MNTINVTDQSGKQHTIPENNFLWAIIDYLRQYSPDRVKIISEERDNNGIPNPIPTAICMLAKNPELIKHYTDVAYSYNQ